jgi:polyhydroxybutyrate depolymerase
MSMLRVQLYPARNGTLDMKTSFRTLSSLAIIILCALTLAGCGSLARKRSADRLPPGWRESSLEYDGLTRWYRIYIPQPLPEDPSLVLYLHGGTLSMRSLFSPLAKGTNTWLRIAEEQGVVLIVPNGVNPKNGDTYGDDQQWNDLRPDGADGQTSADDTGFLLFLLDQVGAELDLDQPRVFVTGASNGGMMTYRLLIQAPERFAAGAAFIANLPVLSAALPLPDQPTPLMIANGTEDPLMPWDGGMVARKRGEVISTENTVAWWIAANRDNPIPVESYSLPDLNPEDGCRITVDLYQPEGDGAPVLFYTMEGGGHTVPSLADPGWFDALVKPLLGRVCRDGDGAEMTWDFFRSVSDPNYNHKSMP